MSEEEREKLLAKEQRKNAGGILNNTFANAQTGSPRSGCVIAIIVAVILLIRACAN